MVDFLFHYNTKEEVSVLMGEKTKKLYYPVQEVQEQLFPDISKDSIVRLIERGEIPAKRITNKYFVPAWWWDKQVSDALNPPVLKEV